MSVSSIAIKTEEAAVDTLQESSRIDRGFLRPGPALVADLGLVAGALLFLPLAVVAAALLAADFAVFVVRRKRVLGRYLAGTPRLVTVDDFAAVSEAYESAGRREPTMSEWSRLAGHGEVPDWRTDLRYRELIRHYDGGVVADIGCGDGRLCWKYHISAPSSYIGIDVGRDLLQQLSERTQGRAATVEATAEATTLPEESVDFVACSEAFEHLPDPGSALREFCRILRPGGRIVIQSPNATRLRNLNLIHVVCCPLGRYLPQLLLRKVVHENTFVRAYTYHWDFTRQDFDQYLRGLPLRVESMRGATYRFNPEGNLLHRLLHRVARSCFANWAWWDLTVVLSKRS